MTTKTIDGKTFVEENILGKGICYVPVKDLWDELQIYNLHSFKLYDNCISGELLIIKKMDTGQFIVVIISGPCAVVTRANYGEWMNFSDLIKKLRNDPKITLSRRA